MYSEVIKAINSCTNTIVALLMTSNLLILEYIFSLFHILIFNLVKYVTIIEKGNSINRERDIPFEYRILGIGIKIKIGTNIMTNIIMSEPNWIIPLNSSLEISDKYALSRLNSKIIDAIAVMEFRSDNSPKSAGEKKWVSKGIDNSESIWTVDDPAIRANRFLTKLFSIKLTLSHFNYSIDFSWVRQITLNIKENK